VLLLDEFAAWRLYANGLPEALIEPRGVRATGQAQVRWLGALAVLARPEARSMLVVGLGGGTALESVPASIESIEVVELEPEIIRANRAVAARRRTDPLADPRLRLTVNDARGALLLSRRRYDAIVSQPSHPWTAGASNLYTREFFALAREHLAPGGVLVQWMGLEFVDGPLFRALLATLLDVFPHLRVYQPAPDEVLFLASDRPLDVEANVERAVAASPGDFAALGVFDAPDVTAALLLDEAGARRLAAGAPLSTDDRNLLQMRSRGLSRRGGMGSSVERLLGDYEALARPDLAADRVLLVRRLLAFGFPDRAERVAGASPDPLERAVATGLVEIARGRRQDGARRLRRALRLDATHLEARFALVRLRREALQSGNPAAASLAEPLPDPARAVVDGWRRAARDDWAGVRDLEARLARAGPHDPSHDDALRLRARWRLAAGGVAPAREALELLDAVLAVFPEDLLLRARLASAAGSPPGAFRALAELGLRLRPGAGQGELARQALGVLQGVPMHAASPQHRSQVVYLLQRSSR
jgi:hypothetical protein